ncbi:MAG: hypothetical protein FWB75_09600, partial [Oscillospiraceae bacterium]|nr:hypothetical protein [Oscillospiraceae bacterium]
TYISLPGNTKYKIEINLNLHNRSSCPVLVEVRIMRNEDVLMKKRYSYENEENIHIGDEIELASQNGACKLLMRLLTLNKLDIESGIIAVKKITDN